LKRFNEEMLRVEELIGLTASRALISRVSGCFLWKDLYALPDINLIKVK
jgi:hypothetical protein